MGSVTIRPALSSDIPALHAALLALADHIGGREYLTSTPDELLRHGFGENPAFSAEIAGVDGTFAGMCIHFPIFSTWMGMPGVFVQDLYVDPQFRGRKVGDALLRHVARGSRDSGGGYLRLSVDADNMSAQAFYNRLGIRHSDYEQIHKLTGGAFHAFCDGKPN